jgi:hypothetical protein
MTTFIDITIRGSRAIQAAKQGATLYVQNLSGNWGMVSPANKQATIARAEALDCPAIYGVHCDWKNEI